MACDHFNDPQMHFDSHFIHRMKTIYPLAPLMEVSLTQKIKIENIIYFARKGRIDILTPIPEGFYVTIAENSSTYKEKRPNPVRTPNYLVVPISALDALIEHGVTQIDHFDRGYIYYLGELRCTYDPVKPVDCAFNLKDLESVENELLLAQKRNEQWNQFRIKSFQPDNTANITLSDLVIDIILLSNALIQERDEAISFGQNNLSVESDSSNERGRRLAEVFAEVIRTPLVEQFDPSSAVMPPQIQDLHNKLVPQIIKYKYKDQTKKANEKRNELSSRRISVILDIIKERYGSTGTTHSATAISHHIFEEYCSRFGTEYLEGMDLTLKRGKIFIPPKSVAKLTDETKESVRTKIEEIIRSNSAIKDLLRGKCTKLTEQTNCNVVNTSDSTQNSSTETLNIRLETQKVNDNVANNGQDVGFL